MYDKTGLWKKISTFNPQANSELINFFRLFSGGTRLTQQNKNKYSY
jgi:hypothetical protein